MPDAISRNQLDDPSATPCGRCDNCTRVDVAVTLEDTLVEAAGQHLRETDLEIQPRKQWIDIGVGPKGRIPEDHRVEPGRVLSIYADGGWGTVVKKAKAEAGAFGDDLIQASAELIATRWNPHPFPEWVTCVPSMRKPELVSGFARGVAERLGIPFVAAVRKTRDTAPQKEMENSAQQLRNIYGAFEIEGAVPAGPALLIDDMVDSGWTLAVIGAALREAGSGPLYPFALARSTAR